MSKYPNLVDTFPRDIVDQVLAKLEESDDAFLEFLIELCHTYSQNMVYAFWTGLSARASSLMSELTLDNFESLLDEQNAKSE